MGNWYFYLVYIFFFCSYIYLIIIYSGSIYIDIGKSGKDEVCWFNIEFWNVVWGWEVYNRVILYKDIIDNFCFWKVEKIFDVIYC